MKNTSNPVITNEDYKIILRDSQGWQKYTHARLQISVLPKPTFDPRVRAILDWTLDNFDSVTLCLHDSIQRYNHRAGGMSPDDAYRESLSDGDKWLSQNICAADVFVDVLRWDALLAHPRYLTVHEEVRRLYDGNASFAAAIDHDTNEFAARCRKRGEYFDDTRLLLSRDFLLEEVAAYIPLYQDSSAVDIHPGMRMKAMQLLIDGLGGFSFQPNLRITAKTFDLDTASHAPKTPRTNTRYEQ